ncbi:UNVERIFIED_CONTAM: hypothetical protein PYX00_009265 [Menopon gallinae]|uniref:SprT-like domain-containing protein n=1 Tax=Menopon gallinae TaxID=328185 RepID=A0AAW2HAW4_9NEOP
MYFVEDEKFPQDLQRKLSSFGVGSSRGTYDKENLIDSKLEYHDPTPNIHELFTKFDKRFFWGQLGSVEVMWSNRMTSCAGLCRYHGRSGQCSIKLSAPLLSLRPRKNLVETLLHEMIHAYLFVTRNYKDRDDHGPEFHKHMYRINKEAGTNITVYHDFNDEVAYYQKHIWRCNGPCQTRRPYFGFVRRAMNRAPGPTDRWWAEHQQTCGGTYIKISEPEKTDKKKGGKETDKDPKHKVSKTPVKIKDIRDFFPSGSSQKLPVNFRDSMKKVSNIHTFKDLNGSPIPKVSDKKVRTFSETNVLGSNTRKLTEVEKECEIITH